MLDYGVEECCSMFLIEARRLMIVLLGSFLLAISLNFFLIEANVYASGFTGAAQLVASILNDFFNIPLTTGVLLFVFIVIVFIFCCYIVSKDFTILCFIYVFYIFNFIYFLLLFIIKYI